MDQLKIGEGERAAIAAAKARGFPLAIDDERAWKRAAAFCSGIRSESTVSVMVSLIRARVIDVAQADAIKADWTANHRFRLRFGSFAEKI
jgi:predicted nucleic acid-binding protein